jgi:hypothetical protein
MLRRLRRARRRLILATAAAAALAGAVPAAGFDTSSHADITRDALGAEGFGATAADVVRVNNWFVDLYENSEDLSHSGHGGVLVTLLGGGYGDREHWSPAVVEAADRAHFDSTNRTLSDTAAVAAEWDRLRAAVEGLVREARDRDDPLAVLTVLGISLHQVQDFYTHTNWVEPAGRAGFDGPGWTARGLGTSPTWFDLPPEIRDGRRVHAGGSIGVARGHGSWKSDGNRSLATAMNKDWPGRPLYDEAYTSAFFATRQWVQAVRGWVGDEAFWRRVMAYADTGGGDLAHDVRGSERMSIAAGHWQGQGEPCRPALSLDYCGANEGPGGRLTDLRTATNDFFEDRPKTRFRRTWEGHVTRVGSPVPVGQVREVPSSQPLQRTTRFVKAQVTSIREVDDMDFLAADQAEYYTHAAIGGQRYRSAVIFGEDDFGFARPHHPFTFIKSVPVGRQYPEPLTTLRVEIRTGDVDRAGTDDDVTLRVGGRAFALDKRLYDDFERGDRDVYSVPIDAAAADGMSVNDIRSIRIEKSPDGRNGEWRLEGVTVIANGRTIYDNQRIGRWLQGASRAWQATGFTPVRRVTTAVPVWLQLKEKDTLVYGDDDHPDIHPDDARRDLATSYSPGAPAQTGEAAGGSRYGGRLGDRPRARLRYRIGTIVPVPIGGAAPAPTPRPAPARPGGAGAPPPRA